MTDSRLELGAWGEDEAVRFLQRQGIKVIERNFRTPVGEIDIIGSDPLHLIFVEVKTRRGNAFGTPQEAVGLRKQRQIIRTAQWYLQQRKTKLQPRFDVVAIIRQSDGKARINHIVDAFSLNW